METIILTGIFVMIIVMMIVDMFLINKDETKNAEAFLAFRNFLMWQYVFVSGCFLYAITSASSGWFVGVIVAICYLGLGGYIFLSNKKALPYWTIIIIIWVAFFSLGLITFLSVGKVKEEMFLFLVMELLHTWLVLMQEELLRCKLIRKGQVYDFKTKEIGSGWFLGIVEVNKIKIVCGFPQTPENITIYQQNPTNVKVKLVKLSLFSKNQVIVRPV